MDENSLAARIENIPDDVLQAIAMSFPWQATSSDGETRASAATAYSSTIDPNDETKRQQLQDECWRKFHSNPQVNTAVRGLVGRLTGKGFSITSAIPQIQKEIDTTIKDYRNRLYNFMPKYTGRAMIEGELFLCFTIHSDGFVEIDFIDPKSVVGGDTGGIIFHPNKPLLPLFYCIDPNYDPNKGISSVVNSSSYLVPSIYIARNPLLVDFAKNDSLWNLESANKSKNPDVKFKPLGGFNRFIVSWDRSFLLKRNVSYLQTVLEWLTHYENLKKYEIDHKRSSGAYVWAFTFQDIKAWKIWLSLTDSEREKTGMGAKLGPGGRLFIPPGIEFKAVNPTLPKISEGDTDIMEMVSSGLNEPSDVTTGQAKGTFASVKASRGPMSDRIADEIEYFQNFLRYDFWGSVFFLKSIVSKFPKIFKVREAVDFEKKKPKFEMVEKSPEDLIDINFPVSEVTDVEARARGWLGVKHGSTYDTLGIANKTIAEKLGVQNYRTERLKQATEEDLYPELITTEDQEAVQEKAIQKAKESGAPKQAPKGGTSANTKK